MPWLFILSFIFLGLTPCWAFAISKNVVEIALFDGGKKHPHHIEVRNILLKEIKTHCAGKVVVKDFSLFDAKGSFDSKFTVKNLKILSRKPSARVFHFSWNDAKNPIYESFEQELKKMAGAGALIVSAAGENVDDPNRMLKLSETVMGSTIGKADSGFLVGEMNDRGQLSVRSNYGEELFTALPPAEKKLGSSFSAPLFSARLACALALKKRETSTLDLVKLLRVKKNSLNTLYPSLEILFPKND